MENTQSSTVSPIFEKLFTKLGIEYVAVGRRLQVHCAFHHDVNPSCAVYDDGDTEHYHCWTCELTLDPIQFYQKFTNISYNKARHIIESDFAYTPRPTYYDNFVVLRQCKMLNEKLYSYIPMLSRRRACKIGELIDQLEWMVRNGKLSEEKFVFATNALKQRIEDGSSQSH